MCSSSRNSFAIIINTNMCRPKRSSTYSTDSEQQQFPRWSIVLSADQQIVYIQFSVSSVKHQIKATHFRVKRVLTRSSDSVSSGVATLQLQTGSSAGVMGLTALHISQHHPSNSMKQVHTVRVDSWFVWQQLDQSSMSLNNKILLTTLPKRLFGVAG